MEHAQIKEALRALDERIKEMETRLEVLGKYYDSQAQRVSNLFEMVIKGENP